MLHPKPRYTTQQSNGKHHYDVYVYYKTCNIDQKASISSFKECYYLHPNLPILYQSVTKNNWDSLYFHKKIHKKTLDLLKVTQNPPPPNSMLCQSWRSHARQWRLEMSCQFNTNIEYRGKGGHNFCHWLQVSNFYVFVQLQLGVAFGFRL